MFLEFNDYIEYCSKCANGDFDWIDIFNKEIKLDNDKKDDYFIMGAMINNEESIIRKCLENFEWGFTPDSFGKSTFWKSYGDEEKIIFTVGNTYEHFDELYEYLIAYRTFSGNYETEIEINPALVWYGNLAKTQDGYIDTITNDLKIKVQKNKVSILKEYLRDFLAAYNKVCIVGYDNRRFVRNVSDIEKDFVQKTYDNYNFSLVIEKDDFSDYDYYSSILGKIIIRPYNEPLHEDYIYLKPEEKQYSEFIIAVDKSSGKEVTYTCNEDKLGNFFGANEGAPQFLTPVYFTKDVLDRYTNNPEQYNVADDHIMFLNIWSLPYTVNNDDKVVVWLGDLGRIPFKEQQYWRVFNIKPFGQINEKFVKRQLMAEWTDSIGEEKTLFSLLNEINNSTKRIYGEYLFKQLSDGDRQLESAFIIPSNNSLTQYQTFLIQLNKLTVERINTKLIEKEIVKEKLIDTDGKKFRSRIQFGIFLKEINISNADECDKIFKLISDCRNKLAGHIASIPQYNKLWNRQEDDRINCISDAKELLTKLNKSLSILNNELGS